MTLLLLLLTMLPGAKRDLVQIDAPLSFEAKAGNTIEIPIKFLVSDGYHINSNKPTEEYMIPTRIDWQPSSIKHESDSFPTPKMADFKFSVGKKLSVFEGASTVKAKFTVPAGVSGKVVVEGTFRYQACDQAACYPPNKVEVKIPVNVK